MNVPNRDDRFHAGDRPRDMRTAGQRDRDRVMYSSAFRRLGGVTQVAAATDESDGIQAWNYQGMGNNMARRVDAVVE